MSLRIRGGEVFAQLVVDGDLKVGSFAKIENFKITPRADLVDTGFLGEPEDEPDVMHHGYDWSFSMHETDNGASSVWDQVVSALAAGTVLPRINVVIIKKYRDTGIPPVVMTLQNCVMKLDSQDFGSRKDYVKSMFSGKCRTKKTR